MPTGYRVLRGGRRATKSSMMTPAAFAGGAAMAGSDYSTRHHITVHQRHGYHFWLFWFWFWLLYLGNGGEMPIILISCRQQR